LPLSGEALYPVKKVSEFSCTYSMYIFHNEKHYCPKRMLNMVQLLSLAPTSCKQTTTNIAKMICHMLFYIKTIKQKDDKNSSQVEGLIVLTEAISSALLRDGPLAFWERIKNHVQFHFGYKLRMWNRGGTPGAASTTTEDEAKNNLESEEMHNYQTRAHPIPFIRRVCQLTGVRMASRDYELLQESRYPFSPADVRDVVPVLKTSIPDWPLDEARQFLSAARAHVAAWSPNSQLRSSHIKQPSPAQAFQLANQSVNLVNQVNGSCHRSAADGYQVIAAVLNHVGEDAAAIAQQLHALVLMDKDGARDSPAVAHAHAWLAR
jgi:hypothetical protein